MDPLLDDTVALVVAEARHRAARIRHFEPAAAPVIGHSSSQPPERIGHCRRLTVLVESISRDIAAPVRYALRLAMACSRRGGLPAFRRGGRRTARRLVVAINGLL